MAGEPLRESVLGLHLVADDLDTPLAILHGIPFTDQTLAKLYWGGLRFVGTSRRLARSDTTRPKCGPKTAKKGGKGRARWAHSASASHRPAQNQRRILLVAGRGICEDVFHCDKRSDVSFLDDFSCFRKRFCSSFNSRSTSSRSWANSLWSAFAFWRATIPIAP